MYNRTLKAVVKTFSLFYFIVSLGDVAAATAGNNRLFVQTCWSKGIMITERYMTKGQREKFESAART